MTTEKTRAEVLEHQYLLRINGDLREFVVKILKLAKKKLPFDEEEILVKHYMGVAQNQIKSDSDLYYEQLKGK